MFCSLQPLIAHCNSTVNAQENVRQHFLIKDYYNHAPSRADLIILRIWTAASGGEGSDGKGRAEELHGVMNESLLQSAAAALRGE